MSKQLQGTKTLADVITLVDSFHTLLSELACNNVTNAIRVVRTLRHNVVELHEQNNAMMRALGCTNWQNAVKRAEYLMKKSGATIDPPTHGIPLVGGGSGVKCVSQD